MPSAPRSRGFDSGEYAPGRTAREAVAQNQDPVHAVQKCTRLQAVLWRGGRVLHAARSGFSWNLIKLEGVPEDAGHTYKIWNKNENIVGKVDATTPATMTRWIPKPAKPSTGRLMVGSSRCRSEHGWGPVDPCWRTPKGIEYFGPRQGRFDFDYASIEQLQKARNNPPGQLIDTWFLVCWGRRAILSQLQRIEGPYSPTASLRYCLPPTC